MFALTTPELRDLDVFTRMPAQLRRTGQRVAWADANRGGHPDDCFLEGPVFDDAGNLYVTDIPWGRIFRIDAAGAWELVAEYDGEPNGMKFLDAGKLLITDYKNGLMALDIASGQVRPYLERRNSERFKGVNDLVFDSRGNLYFTDQGQSGLHEPSGRVYRLAPDGRLDLLLANVPSPNGVVLAPDERVLFVAATRGNCVWRVPLLDDGSVARSGSSSLHTGRAGPTAWRWTSRAGYWSPIRGWAMRGCSTTMPSLRSCCAAARACRSPTWPSAEPERRTLYCTESVSGRILRTTLDVSGLPLHRPPS